VPGPGLAVTAAWGSRTSQMSVSQAARSRCGTPRKVVPDQLGDVVPQARPVFWGLAEVIAQRETPWWQPSLSHSGHPEKQMLVNGEDAQILIF